jgi:hypothetical protein
MKQDHRSDIFRALVAHDKGLGWQEESKSDARIDKHGGKLLTEVVPVRNPKARILTGRLDFSIVYGTSGPAGAPPFGRYTLNIHWGVTERGQVLPEGPSP